MSFLRSFNSLSRLINFYIFYRFFKGLIKAGLLKTLKKYSKALGLSDKKNRVGIKFSEKATSITKPYSSFIIGIER